MKEFYWWVLIVTFMLALLCFSIASALYANKQMREAKAILLRVEQLEKKKPLKEKERDDE